MGRGQEPSADEHSVVHSAHSKGHTGWVRHPALTHSVHSQALLWVTTLSRCLVITLVFHAAALSWPRIRLLDP